MGEKKDNYKKWNLFTLLTIGVILGVMALVVVIIDPYWHFHGPVETFSYRLGNGRYMNDGILMNYDYDTIIIGTSMSENFKTSQWESLTDDSAVKVPFFGAYYKELHDTLERAYNYSDSIQNIIWGLDYNQLTNEWDKKKYEVYLEYLYDDSIWNDGNYLWNKTVLLRGALPDILYTIVNKESTSFDEYGSWEEESGKKAVLTSFTPGEGQGNQEEINQEMIEKIEMNVQKNVEDLVKEHPETQFYLFYTPYSIAYWDTLYYSGRLDIQIEATKIFSERLLQYDNVKLYCFFDNYEMICDLDNYVDAGHYNSQVNEKILQWMVDEEYLLTEDNYEQRIEELGQFYREFDYQGYWAD